MRDFSKYKPEDITNLITDLVVTYWEDGKNYSDDQILQLRADLSVLSVALVEEFLEPLLKEKTLAWTNFEKVEAITFKTCYDNLINEKKSQSVANDLARKFSKLEDDYIPAFERLQNSNNSVRYIESLREQLNQVLNSCSKRNRL